MSIESFRSAREILEHGARTHEPPEVTLERLFDFGDKFGGVGSKDVARVFLSYRAPRASGLVGGYRAIRKDLLQLHSFKVWRDSEGSICVDILDYVDYDWPKRCFPLSLFDDERHAACLARMKEVEAGCQ